MTDASIVVGVRGETAGARRVKRDLNEIADSGDRATAATKLLQRALAALGGAFIVRTLQRTADSFTTLTTQIRNVTKSTAQYNKVFNDLYRIAQQNGDTFEGLASTYQKLNISLDESVAQSTDLVKVTELLSRGFAASGTSAQTAAGASLQLTQGLATDFKAAGQELNSIIEGAPLLAKAIAVQLGGKSAADLKIFAQEGKLTAKVFLDALIAAEDAVYAFEIPPTIGRSLQRVQNSFLKFIGQSDDVVGASRNIANALDLLASSLDVVFKSITVLIGASIPLMVRAFAQQLPAAIAVTATAVKGLTALIAANPIGAIAVAIAAAVTAFKVFKTEIMNGLASVELFGVNGAEAFYIVKNVAIGAARGIGLAFINVFGLIVNGALDAANEVKRILNNIPMLNFEVDAAGSNVTAQVTRLRTELAQIGKDVAEGYKQDMAALNQVTNTGTKGLDAATRSADKLDKNLEATKKTVENMGSSFGDAFTDFVTGANSAGDAVKGLIGQIARLVAQQTIAAPLAGAFSSFAGPALTSFFGGAGAATASATPLGPAFATGGSMTVLGNRGNDRNQLSLNGNPIARVSHGEQIQVNSKRSMAQGAPVVVNITNNTPATVSAQERTNADGTKSLQVMIDEAVAQNIGRKGSKTNRAINNLNSNSGVARR